MRNATFIGRDPSDRTVSKAVAAPAMATGDANSVLDWVKDIMAPRLRSTVDLLPVSVRGVAGYHFGWYDEGGQPVECSPGKLLRPALTLLCAQAVGSSAERAIDAAVAVELVHNFSILHDDVMDGDATRRHRRTVWSLYGVPTAILVGDALLVLAMDMLASEPASVSLLCSALQELVHGQQLDMSFEGRDDVGVEECLVMAADKTAALLKCAAGLGAVHGGGKPEQVRALSDFGWHLGVAFQLVDDLLGIWGDPGITGKPAMADLRARKKSLPVVAALSAGGKYSSLLADLYGRSEPLEEQDLKTAAHLIEQAGGRSWTESKAEHHVAAARTCLTAAQPVDGGANSLIALSDLVTRRDR